MYALLADLLTLSRVAAAILLIWLGLAYDADHLPTAILVVALAWTTDQLDGWAARRSPTPTRLGPYDFTIDVAFYLGILGYLVATGFVPILAALIFLSLAIAAWLITRRKAVGVLCLRMVDLFTAWVLFSRQPRLGFIILAWLLVLAGLYRKRLFERIPRWLNDMRALGRSRAQAEMPDGESAPASHGDGRPV